MIFMEDRFVRLCWFARPISGAVVRGIENDDGVMLAGCLEGLEQSRDHEARGVSRDYVSLDAGELLLAKWPPEPTLGGPDHASANRSRLDGSNAPCRWHDYDHPFHEASALFGASERHHDAKCAGSLQGLRCASGADIRRPKGNWRVRIELDKVIDE